ncbi:Uncharacterised protein [Enterobacter hormaechei]|nr:Uncharacterised protein [Enterobacter hormaechei]CZY86715.1 Uncharacterised protein [Enterobacter hormaechei]SAC36436.1 Uncharacterised protein [Enterobacter hormaechei]SAD98184.1 Uncharacterised protein [Enterobacter hormaechei]SAH75604.1 Uncharacterised protein [Enterobacter hormaechei]
MLRQQRQLFCVLRVYIPALTGFTINGIGREQAGRIAADQHHRTLKIFRGQDMLRYRYDELATPPPMP